MEAAIQRNYHLDVIRVLAAFTVVFSHVLGMFLVPYRDVGAAGPLIKLLYVQHYLARGGVMCFFALSGYLVGNSVLNAINGGRWSWSDYLVRRLTRLHIVLIPALLMTALFDFVGSRISAVYAYATPDYSWKNFLGCLIFLQQVVEGVNPFGTNGPLWSLSYEFWYYILFPILALIFIRRRQLWILVPFLAAVAWLTFGSVLFLFSIWLAGVATAYTSRKYPLRSPLARRLVIFLSSLGFLAVTLACGAHKLNVVHADYLYGFFAIPLVWACLCVPVRSTASLYARAAVLLSEFSYTLYLTHFPFLMLVKALWISSSVWQPDYPHLLLSLVPFAASILFAYGFSLLFESNTDVVRKFVHKKLERIPIARFVT